MTASAQRAASQQKACGRCDVIPGIHLKKIVAGKQYRPNGKLYKRNQGLTLFPPAEAPKLLMPEQTRFFEHFGYEETQLEEAIGVLEIGL